MDKKALLAEVSQRIRAGTWERTSYDALEKELFISKRTIYRRIGDRHVLAHLVTTEEIKAVAQQRYADLREFLEYAASSLRCFLEVSDRTFYSDSVNPLLDAIATGLTPEVPTVASEHVGKLAEMLWASVMFQLFRRPNEDTRACVAAAWQTLQLLRAA